MIIYIGLIILVIALGSKNVKKPLNKALYVTVIGSLMFLLLAFRSSSVGVDTIVYYNNYSVIRETPFSGLHKFRMEPGFILFVKILGLISSNPQTLLIVSGFIIIFSVSLFIYNYSPDTRISFLLFILLMFMFTYMNVMRQAIAISILLLGFKHLLNNNIFRYIIYILIASTFHIAAIFMMPILLLAKFKVDFKTIIIISISIITLFFLFTPGITLFFKIFPKYSHYSDNIHGASNYFGALIDFLLYALIFIIVFIYFDYEEQTRFDRLFIWLFIMQMVFQIFTMKMTVVNRVGQIYSIFLIIGIPLLINKSKKLYIRQLVPAIIMVSMAYFIIISIFRPEWNGALPYLPFWR